MKFAIQRCCTTPVFLKQYESSTNAVLEKFGIELVDIKGSGCCGYPLKSISLRAHLLCSARNLALACKEKLDIITVCNCCYGTLRHVNQLLQKDRTTREEINQHLKKERLTYDPNVQVRHVFEVLYKEVGLEKLTKKAKTKFAGLKIAAHYGCHILRPRQVVQLDNPLAPTIFDKLIEITGAESIPWSAKLKCCGSPVLGVNDDLSEDLTVKKITSAKESGADYLCVACPYCQLQFDRVQKMILAKRNGEQVLPSILYTQLLGISLGLNEEHLRIQTNEVDASGIVKFLA